MKTYTHMFAPMLKPDVVASRALDAAEGKLRRKEVIDTFVYFDRTYELVVACANDPDYKPCEDNTHEIIDGANHKPREIEKPKFCPEQILHHVIIEPFKKVLMDGLYEHVYGCLPPVSKTTKDGKVIKRKFGPHAAIKQLVKWIKCGKKIYVGETDIHHAYGSTNIPILCSKLKRVIRDKDWLRLTFQFLHYNDKTGETYDSNGLVLGHYTSPWFFNFYLKEFDHFAATIDGIKYLRFADNIFIVGTNKRKVHRAMNIIRDYLKNNLCMELNSCTQVYRFEYFDKRTNKVRGRAVNALGAVIHHNRVTLRKSILMRMRRKSLKIKKKYRRTWHDGASMISRIAWVRHTDIYTYYYTKIKPNINIRELKNKVRNHSRMLTPVIEQRRKIIYDGLEKSSRLSA